MPFPLLSTSGISRASRRKVNMMFKRFVSWLVEGIVFLVDFLIRLWSPELKIKKEKYWGAGSARGKKGFQEFSSDPLPASSIPPRRGLGIKEVIGDLLVIGLSAALLWHFWNIWVYGQLLVQEPNIIIRSLETAMLLIIFAFGVSRLVVDFRR